MSSAADSFCRVAGKIRSLGIRDEDPVGPCFGDADVPGSPDAGVGRPGRNFVGNQSVDAISCLTASTDPSSEWSSTTMSSTAVPSELMIEVAASVTEA